MSPLISTNIIDSLPHLNQRILGRSNTLDPTFIRCRTESNLLLPSRVITRNLTNLQLANRNKRGALVSDGGVVQDIIGIRNVCVDGEDKGLLREPLLKIVLQIVGAKFLQLLRIGIEMLAISGDETISDICDFAVFVRENVSVRFVVRYGAIIEGIWLLSLHEGRSTWMAGKEGSECHLGFLQVVLFLGGAAVVLLGFVKQELGNFHGAEKLEES